MKRASFSVASLAILGTAAVVGCASLGDLEDGSSAAAGGGAGGGSYTSSNSTPGDDPVNPKRSGGGDGKQDGIDESDNGSLDVELPVCGGAHPTLPFFLSADDSNSMASPVLAREWLSAGLAPSATQIRTYEFLNYYNALYPLPNAADGKLGVHAEMQDLHAGTSAPGRRYRLQLGVQAFALPRVPLVLTFVVDTSGSLVGPGIERAREALLAVTSQLQAGDIVNVVTWASEDNVVLEGYLASGDAADGAALSKAVSTLVPGGGSDLHAGLVKGYALAGEHFNADKLNRVVLISDGAANVGVIDRDVIASAATQANDEGVYLVGVGVGPANGYSDTLMNLVTDAGRGAYVYLDDPGEAQSVLGDRFDEVMSVAARNVQVELDLPPYLEIEEFYGEEYSSDQTKIEPQNLAPGDSMIFNETLVATTTSLVCADDEIIVRVSWETPLTHELRQSAPLVRTLSQLLAVPPSPQMLKANAVIAYAEALKSADPVELQQALDQVDSALAATGDPDLGAIAALLANHPSLQK